MQMCHPGSNNLAVMQVIDFEASRIIQPLSRLQTAENQNETCQSPHARNRHVSVGCGARFTCIAKQKTGGWITEQSVLSASIYSNPCISSGIRPLTLPA